MSSHISEHTRPSQADLARLDLFLIRCCDVFGRVLNGRLNLLDATDLLYDASVASGIDQAFGTDHIQKCLAAAFASAAAEHDNEKGSSK